MNIVESHVTPNGQFGGELVLTVADLHPTETAGHIVVVPLACFVDRRLRELVPPCAECPDAPRLGTVLEEHGDHTRRMSASHLPENCPTDAKIMEAMTLLATARITLDARLRAEMALSEDERDEALTESLQTSVTNAEAALAEAESLPDCEIVSTCTCCVCACCTQAIEIVLSEHFSRLNPDKLGQLDTATAKRLVQIRGVPGKTLNGDGEIADTTAPTAQAVAIKATGALVATG